MSDPENRSESDTADRPTRLQRAARRGCAVVAYAVVLMPVALGIWFFSTIPRGWEQFGGMVRNIMLVERGAHTEIIVPNISGHDVQIDLIRFDEHRDRFSAPLEAERENDPDQNIVRYQEIYFRDIVPRRFPVEIRYTELDTGVKRSASFTADRTPRRECAFVMFLGPDSPELSDCRRSDLEDFSSP
jgi:hypothetical protein